MTAPGLDQNNHYVPQFLQRPWCGKDGRLTVFTRWSTGKLSTSRLKPEYTGFEPNLTALEGVADDQRHIIEETVLKGLDSDAAVVHHKLLAGEVPRLTGEERTTFAHFVMSLRARTPDAIAMIKAGGEQALRDEFGRDDEEYAAERLPGDPETFFEFAAKQLPAKFRNFGLSLLPAAIMNEDIGRYVFRADWWVMSFPGDKHDLLLGDRPAILLGDAIKGAFTLALPISPTRAFFASSSKLTREAYTKMTARDLAMRLNRSTVHFAKQRVYGADRRHERLIVKRLGRPWHDHHELKTIRSMDVPKLPLRWRKRLDEGNSPIG